MTLQEIAHVAEIDRIVRSLQAGGGVVVVHGPEPQQSIDLALIALGRLPHDHVVGVVDITRCQDDAALARALAVAVAATYVGSIPDEAFGTAQWLLERDADLLALAEQTSPRFYAALTRTDAAPPNAGELFELSVDAFTRRAADGPAVIAFLGADELAASSKKRSRFEGTHDQLWKLRGRLQQSIGSDYVVFAGGTRTVELIASDDAAFYGWGTEVSVEQLPFDLLRRHLYAILSEQFERFGLDEPGEALALSMNIAQASSGSALLAEQFLEILPLVMQTRPRPRRVQEFPITRLVLLTLLELNAERLRALARLVKGLAPNAMRVAAAIAGEAPPYSVVEHPSDASRALTAMAENGIATRREGSRWTLCDPLFALWLKQPPAGRLRLAERSADAVPRWALTS